MKTKIKIISNILETFQKQKRRNNIVIQSLNIENVHRHVPKKDLQSFLKKEYWRYQVNISA